MKRLLLSSLLLAATAVHAEGSFVFGASLTPDNATDCGLLYCGSVTQEIALPEDFEPKNTGFAASNEDFFNIYRGGYFYSTYHTDYGVAYIDVDETAEKYSEQGFYLLTRYAEYGVLPNSAKLEVTNTSFTYGEDSVTVSFDWGTNANPYGAIAQWALYSNNDRNYTDHLSYWELQNDAAKPRIVVESAVALEQIDVHAVIDGQQYNFGMVEVYDNFWEWEIPPTVASNSDVEIFFNYMVNGLGYDTPVETTNTGRIYDLFNVGISAYRDQVQLTDQINYPILGELGQDEADLEAANFMYKVNGGELKAYPMTREVLYKDGIREVIGMNLDVGEDLQSGDVVEYSVHYVYKGVPYTSAWASKTLY